MDPTILSLCVIELISLAICTLADPSTIMPKRTRKSWCSIGEYPENPESIHQFANVRLAI
jgi:hypothetical protein